VVVLLFRLCLFFLFCSCHICCRDERSNISYRTLSELQCANNFSCAPSATANPKRRPIACTRREKQPQRAHLQVQVQAQAQVQMQAQVQAQVLVQV